MSDFSILWYWVREREAIRLRRETSGNPSSWTEDYILQTYRFCNVRREDDRVTQWVREHIRQRFGLHPNLWLMLCIARQINWPDTLAELIASDDAWPRLHEHFVPSAMTTVLSARKARGIKVYTGAYTISAPHAPGSDKGQYVAETVIGDLWRRRGEFADWDGASLQGVHARLMKSPGWGPFMAYQAVVDMRFTRLLDRAPDVSTWAAAGPGTLRGLNRAHGRPAKAPLPQAQALLEMLEIHRLAPSCTGVQMDLSDVPNILCEYDKYERVKNGDGKPRARFVPGRGW